jgi:hypothetical protein
MSEYMESQREIASKRRRKLESEAKQKWTPTNILNSACIPWLMEGMEVAGHGGDAIGSAVALSMGCSGGCGKVHPRITLSFSSSSSDKSSSDAGESFAKATLSHSLDPFIDYFDNLCQEGLATKQTGTSIAASLPRSAAGEGGAGKVESSKRPTMASIDDEPIVYRLSGFLERHIEMLRKTPNFEYHLVEVSPRDMSASRRAHENQLEAEEEEQQRVKRLKRPSYAKSTTGSDDVSEREQNPTSILDDVLGICYENQSLKNHLNMAEISWMRLTGHKAMTNVAARLAGQRMWDAEFSFSVLVTPSPPEILGQIPNPHEGRLILQQFLSTSLYQEYVVLGSHRPLVSSCRTNPEFFVPKTDQPHEYRWTNNNNNVEQDQPQPRQEENSARGNVIIRVYLEQLLSDPVVTCRTTKKQQAPEYDCLLQRNLPIEIARFRIDARDEKPEGTYKSPCSKLTYKVLPGGITSSGGGISIESVDIGFQDVLGIYARKKLPIAKQDMQMIKKDRPLKRHEKEFVKGLAKLAREMPRSKEPFLKGW